MMGRSGVASLGRLSLLALGTFWAAGACSSDESSHPSPDAGVTADAGCTPGETRDCRFDELCDGLETCQPDGSFGACQCDAVPQDGSGGIVGARCAADSDCLAGAQCLRADGNQYVNGGPAGGYCTYACSATSDCTSHDVHSDCEPVGPNSEQYCIRTCLSKEPEPGEAKCLNRPDLVCESIAADTGMFTADRQDGFCVPMCGSDAECPAGRYCNLRNHVCFLIPSAGSATGSPCSFDADCDGYQCENRVNGVGTCTASCTVGSLAGCGYARDAAQRDVACLQVQVAASAFSEGTGDLGYCRELCDVDSDCIQAAHGFVCRPLSDAAVAFFGRKGACAPSGG